MASEVSVITRVILEKGASCGAALLAVRHAVNMPVRLSELLNNLTAVDVLVHKTAILHLNVSRPSACYMTSLLAPLASQAVKLV